ncbi:DUF2637 domain-containing protein [Streptomyces sp. NBC_00989]|uniref:DUF2637 domain-containing protein n=1 Tax=Streptomyces sp. NBC_00989 TaxID=2903705 RepID=UPI002F90BA95|nr:DUF2637 domain-containing protein [Streptomyces sp. NBC_00989]
MNSPSPPPREPNGDGTPNGLSRLHWILIGVVVAGAAIIAAIGFSGSYAAVRELAADRGFGGFAPYFPIGIDAGILVLLALDLLLTWIRIPFPLLRQTAWLLTAATIAFNGASAWPDPLGVAMHAVIPVLFIVAVEAARHAIGRIADITADKHMEGVRFTRWLLSPVPTFLLWRRMKLWELRSYEQVVRLEQDRLVYKARLRARFGRAWRRKAPVDAMTPLRLARYGVPLAQTGPAGLLAAGITAPVVFFADNAVVRADNTRTTSERTDVLSGPADNDARVLSVSMPSDADNGVERPLSSALSARMSAPAGDGGEHVRADNGGHPLDLEIPQHGRYFTDESVRADARPGPAGKEAVAALSAADMTSADNGAPDKTSADNRADTTPDMVALDADNAADNGGRSEADNEADNGNADNDADKKPPRGALTNGVRRQLAVGEKDAGVITDRLSKALGLSVDKKSVARVVRREMEKAAEVQPTGDGPYL